MSAFDENEPEPTPIELASDTYDQSQRWQWLAFTLTAGALIWLLAPVLTPFVISMLLGYLGDPLADRLERAGLGRTMSVFVVFFAMIVLLGLAVLLLGPLVSSQVRHFVDQMPAYAAWLRNTALPWINEHTHVDLSPFIDPQQLAAMLREHWEKEGGVAANVIGGLSRSSLIVIEFVTNLCLVPVLSFYFLRDWDILVARVDALLPRAIQPTIARLARESDEMLGGFLRGQFAVMVTLAIVYTIGLWLVGLDLALLIGLIAGLVSFIPYLGVITGVLLSVIASLVQYGDGWHVLLVLIVFTVGPTLESFVLLPRLVGNKIGMHPVGVIFALMAGGRLFGFLGILLALPMSAVAMVLLRYAHARYTASTLYAGRVSVAEESIALAVVAQRVRVERSDASDDGEPPPSAA
jgi:predicted PurR-regulated permease PerM